MCGGITDVDNLLSRVRGLSPRVRGNPGSAGDRHAPTGPIPACAGESVIGTNSAGAPAAYPRVCGGIVKEQHPDLDIRGLSPRVRGNLIANLGKIPCLGPIPACAGES